MSLTTQDDPKVLVIDTIANLPLPAAVPVGTLLHIQDTQDCRILVEDLATGVRSWEPFCAGAAGPTGPSGPTGPAGPTGSADVPTVMNFAGGRQWAGDELGTPELFFANQSPEDSSGTIYESGSFDAIGYPMPFAAALNSLVINVTQNTFGGAVTLWLSKNGVHVFSHTIPVGNNVISTGSAVPFAANDLVDISIEVPPGLLGGVHMAVSVVAIFFNP